MTELQDKVAESNKAIQRVEESLSARLSVLEREFRYTSTSSTHDGTLASKMTRASEGQVDSHLGQLQKLEQLAKVYGMNGRGHELKKSIFPEDQLQVADSNCGNATHCIASKTKNREINLLAVFGIGCL